MVCWWTVAGQQVGGLAALRRVVVFCCWVQARGWNEVCTVEGFLLPRGKRRASAGGGWCRWCARWVVAGQEVGGLAAIRVGSPATGCCRRLVG